MKTQDPTERQGQFLAYKWQAYPPRPEALIFEEFLTLVDEDKESCFWG